jgi:hypothetical protein
MLYAIVRECMTQAGMLSSSYKFKVLSLDSRGRQYLVMMDLPREHASESGRLAEIESLIARHAKTRHDILVTAVYWRINELVTAGLTLVSTPVTAVDVVLAPEPVSIPAAATAAPSFKPRYEPLQQEEVTAFKKAIASAPTGSLAVATGSFVVSGPRNPTPFPDFEDTEVDERQSALSRTQYGDLI